MASNIVFDGKTVSLVCEDQETTSALRFDEIFDNDIFYDFIKKAANQSIEKYWKLRYHQSKLNKKFEVYTFKGNLEWAILNSRSIIENNEFEWFYDDNFFQLIEEFFKIPRPGKQVVSPKKWHTLDNLRRYIFNETVKNTTSNDTLWLEETGKVILI